MANKLEFAKQYEMAKTVYDSYLVQCLKIPIYKRFCEIYKETFDDKNKTDAKVVVLFQEKMKNIKNLGADEINSEAIAILGHSSCAKYISKLIEVSIYSTNRMFLFTTDAPWSEFDKPLPNSLIFFKTLLSSLGDLFFRDPFIFCRDKTNSKMLKCASETVHLIELVIKDTINVLGFSEDTLDIHLANLKNIHKQLQEMEEQVAMAERQEEEELKKINNELSRENSPQPSSNGGESPKMQSMDDDIGENQNIENDPLNLGNGQGISEIDNFEGTAFNNDTNDDVQKNLLGGNDILDPTPLPDELAIITYKDDNNPHANKNEDEKEIKNDDDLTLNSI